LLNKLQEHLFNSPNLQPYRGLQDSGWIRMEFRSKDQQSGQIRVYVLPGDVGRSTINRQVTSLRRPMQQLLAQLDISKETWQGDWNDDTPVVHLDSSLDAEEHSNTSLFEIFNTLPSPNPNPELVADSYAREAMYNILDSNIKGLTTTLYMYQRRTAALMLQREAQPSQLLDPRLTMLTDQKGCVFYCDLEDGCCLREPRKYDSSKGGICAENMGLGKTLISLALILSTRRMSSQIPVEYSVGTIPFRKTTGSLLDMAATTIGRSGIPWQDYFDLKNAEGYEFSQCAEAIRRNKGYYFLPGLGRRRESRIPRPERRKIWLTSATIVVVPANLVKQWVQEINKHTEGLKVLVMNNNKHQLPLAEELADYDIILFSRQRFDKEAKDGSDQSGRRTSTPNVCHCPYIGSSRLRDCSCSKDEDIYRSPLKDLHFKRLITDEGHTFGNASKSSITDASTVVQFLQVTSRWIVSGTPTQGLYGAEGSIVNSANSSASSSPLDQSDDANGIVVGCKFHHMRLSKTLASIDSLQFRAEQERASYKQERKDLEKLGNIATMYLKARPWANTAEENDVAQWSHHVMQPRHGSKSQGNMRCLRSTLEGMIIRHRPEDVEKDVILPPLHQSIINIDGSFQDKMSLNMFSMAIVSNAITSERKDADYLFHPRQRTALDLLMKNLRQASFHWSGFTLEDVKTTTNISKDFLEKEKVPISPEDKTLLQEAIKVGEIVLANGIKKAASVWHEMPMYIQNDWPENVRAAWSLDGESRNPTLMGATMVHSCQKFVEAQLWKEDPMEGLEQVGKDSLKRAYLDANPEQASQKAKTKKRGNDSQLMKKADQSASILAGGVAVATSDGPSPIKRVRTSFVGRLKSDSLGNVNRNIFVSTTRSSGSMQADGDKKQSGSQLQNNINLKSAMKKSKESDMNVFLNPASPLASTTIISTSSAKLSYLMQRIIVHHETEKILVFYEADNVAYYIAQALECLHIKHLIYAKTLPSDRKSQYVVTFNQTETFRVLLMDISQAAFGLDMSSASRVYFVNPVFSPQVEAQAVKRAHRIGQTKPVFVETLVLKGGIEEVILERRKDMSSEEHSKCKNILNDQKIYDWIRNVRFIPLATDDVPGPEQMTKLETPEPVFGRAMGSRIGIAYDPDADLIMERRDPETKGKRKANVAFDEDKNRLGTSSAANGEINAAVAFTESEVPSDTKYANYESSSTGSAAILKNIQCEPVTDD
jgi:SNF2 family DNA or RNA helicase